MNPETVNVQLPARLYSQLKDLASESQSDPIEVITHLVEQAHQRRAWQRDLDELRQQIEQDGGLQIGLTQDEIVERLRQTRREIFKAEYAHLYR